MATMVLLVILWAAVPAVIRAQPITTATLVRETTDLERLTRSPQPAYEPIQSSSYDRRSDQPGGPGWYANNDGFGGEPIPNVEAVLEGTGAGEIVHAGTFKKIYDPSIGEGEDWYINDHCFIRGEDGTWHLFGITHAEPAAPLDEDHFAHATAERLTQRSWNKQPYALSAQWDPWKEVHLWAPHVIRHEGIYYMFYTAGARDHSQYKIHLATSEDLKHWTRHPENPMVVDGYDARDPFILRHGEEWIMYYTATSEPQGGNHVVAYRTSDDLIEWGERYVAYTDSMTGTSGGPTESPTVVRRGRYFYLFIGPTGGYRDGYVGTDVYRSTSPFQWNQEDQVGHIESHAAEVVRDENGAWYVSHAGWGQGGVYLARLYWEDGLEDAPTSVPVPSRP